MFKGSHNFVIHCALSPCNDFSMQIRQFLSEENIHYDVGKMKVHLSKQSLRQGAAQLVRSLWRKYVLTIKLCSS